MLKKGQDLFFLQDWQVNPSTNTLQRGEQTKQLEPKAMDVLLLLCKQQGEVLSADEIATQCWGGMDIGDNPVHKAVTQLRKALGDKASAPTYIETIRKRGYHIIAKLDFPLDSEHKAEQASWQGVSPFPGLVAFGAKDSQVFFGRNQQISTLLEGLSNQVAASHAFTLILGPSGTGKSSLVNAGLQPALSSTNGYNGIGVISDTSIDFADITPGRLFIDFASALMDWEVNDQAVFSNMSAESLAEQLQTNHQASLALCAQALMQAQSGYNKAQFFLFIDRLEVLLSSPIFSDEERTLLLNIIQSLATSGKVIVIAACRNDFYPLVVNQPSLMAGKAQGSHFDLTAPSRSELMQMIRLPAKAANLSWSKDESGFGLDELLCQEAASNPDSLPMLQYTLQELYLQRSSQDQLEVSVYQALGGIEGAIGKKAEQVYQQLSAEHQSQFAYVLSLLVTLNLDSETITSRAARWSQLDSKAAKEFVQAMVDSRLFVSHLQNSEPCFSLAHEALLRRWNRASEWISDHQDSLLIKSRLQQQSERWLQEGKNNAYLLAKGKPLLEAQSLKQNKVFVLEPNEHALINASLKRLNLIHWFRRTTFSLLCVLTVTAVWMSVKSYQAEALAQQKRLEAESLLGFMVGEFADKLRSVKRMDLLDGISNKALEYFSQQGDSYDGGGLFSLADSEQNFKAQFQHAQTLGAMGEVAYSRAKNDEAKQAFSSAKVILDKLYLEQADNLDLLKTLGANAFWLGQLAMDHAEYGRAKTYFEGYLTYSNGMIDLVPEDTDAQWELSYSYLAIGGINTKLQLYDEAEASIESALAIQYKLVENLSPTDLTNLYIADTLEWLAETEEQLGSLQQAVQTRKKAQKTVNTLLITQIDNADLFEYLAYSYFNTANTQYYLGNYEEAHKAISKAITHFNTMLNQDDSNQVWQLQLIAAQALRHYLATNIQSELLMPLLNFDDFNKALSQLEKQPSIIVIFIKYYQLNNMWDNALEAINLAIPRLEELVSKQPSNGKLLSSLSNIYLALARQLKKTSSDNDNRVEACNKVLDILRPTITLNSSFELILPYVQAYDCLGRVNEIQKFVQRLEYMQIKDYRF